MDADTVDGTLIVRGKLGDTPFEQRYDVHVAASDSSGNAFVPRMYAAARIADLERNGGAEAKKEALALSTQFSVASRYSSLLVLESEAMFRAFGLYAANHGRSLHGRGAGRAERGQGGAAARRRRRRKSSRLESTRCRGQRDKKSGAGRSQPVIRSTNPSASSRGSLRRGRGRRAGQGKSGSPLLPAPMPNDGFAQPPPAVATKPMPPLSSTNRNYGDPRSSRRMIPMRRVWERKGQINVTDRVPRSASISAVADAERALAAQPDRRSNVKKAYSLYAISGDLGRATSLVERWVSKEPLDPDALTARADLAARRGDRELAVRMLGSVVDMRPDDVASQKRLARLYRWSGRADLGCRHAMAIAELRATDPKLLADALRCARAGNAARWASDALALVDEKTARQATSLASAPAPTTPACSAICGSKPPGRTMRIWIWRFCTRTDSAFRGSAPPRAS